MFASFDVHELYSVHVHSVFTYATFVLLCHPQVTKDALAYYSGEACMRVL